MTYNHAQYVEESATALFNQSLQADEIFLSDDNSPDKSFEMIKSASKNYEGPSRIVLNRNAQNLGVVGHVNHLMSMVTGDLIFIVSADDISCPNRIETTVRDWVQFNKPPLLAYSCNVFAQNNCKFKPFVFKRESLRSDWMLEHINSTVMGPTLAWSKEVFTRFGPLPTNLASEDKPIAFRASLLGNIFYRDEKLVNYRIHGGNLSRSRKSSKISRRRNGLVNAEHRLQSFNNDLELAIREGLVQGETLEKLKLSLSKGQQYLHHRRCILFGNLWQNLTSRIALSFSRIY